MPSATDSVFHSVTGCKNERSFVSVIATLLKLGGAQIAESYSKYCIILIQTSYEIYIFGV